MQNGAALADFHVIRPKHTTSQADTFAWLVAAHTQAEKCKRQPNISNEELHTFQESLQETLQHVGCKPGVIHSRGHEIDDFLHQRWDLMRIYRLQESAAGVGLAKRQAIHHEIVDSIFERFYPNDATPPHDMIHVSCTGYTSPSGAQTVAAKRGWWDKTSITHAYHMGCYASVPAIRMASAFVNSGSPQTDIVHTELCTLHLNPSLHDPAQLVGQSLFADGFIKYSVLPESALKKHPKPYLKLLGMHEQLIPKSTSAMTWTLTDACFQFTLSKEIPVFINRHIAEYLRSLCQRAGVSHEKVLQHGIFAIHPGGPKILDYIQETLGLQDKQMQASRTILQCYGNMSSATLPHIWQEICAGPTFPSNTLVVSLAFGPGLTIVGTILEKRMS